MKQVTVAYKEADLQTLLRIEMMEVAHDAVVLDSLSGTTLESYNLALKQQAAELQEERSVEER